MFINLNGQLLPAEAPIIPAASRAFRYGLAVFETMLLQEGRIRLEAFHWERLQLGMEALGISIPGDFFQELAHAARQTWQRNGYAQKARIRIQVWPGSGSYTSSPWTTEYCIETAALPTDFEQQNNAGLKAGWARGIVRHADSFSHLKTCQALPFVQAARQAQARGWDEALLCNQYGRMAEGSISNLFWVSAGRICTPPLSEGCVAGVLRRHLLQFLPSAGFELAEESVLPESLLQADSIWLSNALRGLRWLREYEGRPKATGAAAEIQRLLWRLEE
ncbi:MAG: aminotransferase class IV [Bacteroidetes bacterium]|nr:aminotransferase class IV [Bacteroidota bacterium]